MPDFMMSGFSGHGLMPHGHCFLWPLSLLFLRYADLGPDTDLSGAEGS
jgi:hypothetical protein